MARRTVPTSRHRAARLCIGVLLPAIDKKIKEFADLSGRERAGETSWNCRYGVPRAGAGAIPALF